MHRMHARAQGQRRGRAHLPHHPSHSLQDLEAGGEPFPPFQFLLTLRQAYPQFAQQGREGGYSQQDAEECWTNLLYAVREKAKVGGASRGPGGERIRGPWLVGGPSWGGEVAAREGGACLKLPGMVAFLSGGIKGGGPSRRAHT